MSRLAGGLRVREPVPRPSRIEILAGALALLLGAACGDPGDSTVPDESPPAAAISLPGTVPVPADLARRLRGAVAAKGRDYRPRTRHLNPDGTPRYTNRLILEASPYLLQHAHNPVDWYPWGDEAFARGRAEGKPVLLSVGYATCHWCHVMEEESFEDEEIAGLINQHYVAVKVDREQRPDVDAVYMAAVQRATGHGGWPMTVWLTADRKPFYAGTYFPPRTGVRGARAGFDRLLVVLAERFQTQPEVVIEAADDLASRLACALVPPETTDGAVAPGPLHVAYEAFRQSFDEAHGGFGGAPKFPRPHTVEFLLRYHRRTGSARARDMAILTLEKMAAGGMYDHVGGGFHRYSTDSRWLVPHFEKMLYDNALLTLAYLEGYQVTGRQDLAAVTRDVLSYVGREMTAPAGGFYSATDADSEGEEGTFFVWTRAQLEEVLGADRARIVATYYGVTEEGNFDGANVLHVPRPARAVAADLGLDTATLEATVAESRQTLYRARAGRVPPLTDRKVLASWNGLMISAFARAALVLPDDSAEQATWTRAATRAATFVLGTMRTGGRLQHTWFDGVLGAGGFLDDYAFVAAGLLDLYAVTGEVRWLEEAIALHDVLARHFWDSAAGGYFMIPDDGEQLLAREKPDYDGAEPSGNSVAALNLLRLHELTTQDRYRRMAAEVLEALSGNIARTPVAVPKLLTALDFHLDRAKAIVIVRPADGADATPLLAVLGRTFVPNQVLAVVSMGSEQKRLAALVPLVGDKTAQNGRTTAYVCEERVCALPTADPDVFARQLATTAPLPPT